MPDPDLGPVAVVVLNWNKAALTRHCLATARAATALAATWIVVDNGSSETLDGLPEDVVLLRNETNRGFTGGVNRGIEHAMAIGARAIWLLNSDAEPLPGALDALVAAMDADAAVGLASAVILDLDGSDRIDFHGGRFDGLDYDRTNDPDIYRRWEAEDADKIILVGTALLLRRELVERIGGFDDALFAYEEDIDYSRRSLAAGFRNVVVPGACVRHHCDPPGQVVGRHPYYYYFMARNPLLVHRKLRDPLKSSYWALRRMGRWHGNKKLPAGARRALRLGVLHGLLGRGGPAPASIMPRPPERSA